MTSRWIQSRQLVFLTLELARESAFLGVIDLLRVTKHGKGTNIHLIRFYYVRRRTKRRAQIAR